MILSLNDKFYFFYYLGLSFLPVREDRQNDLYFFSRNIGLLLLLFGSRPLVRVGGILFIFVTKRFSNGKILLCYKK